MARLSPAARHSGGRGHQESEVVGAHDLGDAVTVGEAEGLGQVHGMLLARRAAARKLGRRARLCKGQSAVARPVHYSRLPAMERATAVAAAPTLRATIGFLLSAIARSEERRVGTECSRPGQSRW